MANLTDFLDSERKYGNLKFKFGSRGYSFLENIRSTPNIRAKTTPHATQSKGNVSNTDYASHIKKNFEAIRQTKPLICITTRWIKTYIPKE